MENYNENLEETLLTEYLIKQVCKKASGRADDECLHNLPHDVFFIGNLRPYTPKTNHNQPAHWRELENKLAPFAFGADFIVKPQREFLKARVKLEWSCFYRILPTLTQQHSLQNTVTEEGNSDANDDDGSVEIIEDKKIQVDRQNFCLSFFILRIFFTDLGNRLTACCTFCGSRDRLRVS